VSDESLRRRILATFDLFEAGIDLMRQRLHRQYPAESAQQIEERLAAWLLHRPGAEHGDGVGRVGTWPRRQPR
jgi:Rv0078B-related antitoxin